MNSLFIYTQWLIRKHMRSAVIWTMAFATYVLMIVAIFPTFSEAGITNIASNYPEAMRKAFNIDDMGTLGGFLGVEVFSYAPLVLAFFPIMLLAGAVAGEEERGAMDIYLAQPLSRRDMVLANVITTIVWTLVILMVTGLSTWLLAQFLDIDFGISRALQGFFGLFPIMLLFGSIALFVGTRVRSKGSATGAAFLLMFLLYLVDLVGKLVPDYASIRDYSPFKWYGEPLVSGLDWSSVVGIIAISLVVVILSIVSFERRDIYT